MKHELSGEIWSPIMDFDGYEVSNFGRVRSCERVITICRASCTYRRKQGATILKPQIDKDGYLSVVLYKNDRNQGVHKRVSRLVATAFIPNPNNYSEVNHIDLNRRNNHSTNLEWCNNQYNVTYKDAPMRSGLARRNNKKQSRPVIQYTSTNNFVNCYPSMMEAKRQTGINVSHICQCCIGNIPSAGGYMWRYAKENEI